MRIKYFLIAILLSSCGTMDEAGKALRNEKTRTTDEFLIEKRGPLSIPPKMGELPKPKSSNDTKKDDNSLIETSSENEKSQLENIFLEEIRKN